MIARRRYVFIGTVLVAVVIFGISMNRTQYDFVDLTKVHTPQPAQLDEGYYRSVAWYGREEIALEYTADPDSRESHIILYNLKTGNQQVLPSPPQPAECWRNWIAGYLERMPNGNLAFLDRCVLEPMGSKYTLYAWDQSTASLQVLQAYPRHIAPGRYTFSPNMTSLIHHSGRGAGLNDELYWVDQDGIMTQLVPHFQRAKTPSWSPDGATVAFFGTESYESGNASEPQTWGQIEDRFRAPWDLYLMDAESKETEILLSGIRELGGMVKWSPEGRYLAFSGKYQKTLGLWLYDTTDERVLRLYPERTAFDWSPEGDRLVLLVVTRRVEGHWAALVRPFIIELALEDN